jgi:hypothetical protein
VITEEFELNEKRLDLVENLLREMRLDDARGALDQVTKEGSLGALRRCGADSLPYRATA